MSTVEQFNQALEDPNLLRKIAGGAVVAGILATGLAIATAEPASAHEVASDGKLIIQENDSLWGLVDKHTDIADGEIPSAIERVKERNGLAPSPIIHPGDSLDITFLHQDQGVILVKPNDSLWGLIDANTETPDSEIPEAIEEVVEANNLGSNPVIYANQTLDLSVLDAPLPKPAPAMSADKAPAPSTIPENTPSKPMPQIDKNTALWKTDSVQNILQAVALVSRSQNIDTDQAVEWLKTANNVEDLGELSPKTDLRLPGITKDEWDKLAEGLKHMADVQKIIDATNTQRLPGQREALAQQILQSPNITIQSSPNDRVKKSIEDITNDGKTFTEDTYNNDTNEVFVSPGLMQMLLDTSGVIEIDISSLTTGQHSPTSSHKVGEGVDLALGSDPDSLFRHLYENKDKYRIDELMTADPPDGLTALDKGEPFFDSATLAAEDDHIHVSVQGQQEIAQPPAPTLEAVMAPLVAAEAKGEVLTSTEQLNLSPYSIETNPLSKSGVTAEQLDAFFEEHAPAYNGLGKYFIQVEETRGINAIYNVSHTFNESTRGTSEYARTKNNLYGRNVYDTNPDAGITNSGYAAAIIEYGDFLKNAYLTEPGGPQVPGQRDTPGIWFRGFSIKGVFDKYSTQPGHDQMIVDLMNEIDPQIRAK